MMFTSPGNRKQLFCWAKEDFCNYSKLVCHWEVPPTYRLTQQLGLFVTLHHSGFACHRLVYFRGWPNGWLDGKFVFTLCTYGFVKCQQINKLLSNFGNIVWKLVSLFELQSHSRNVQSWLTFKDFTADVIWKSSTASAENWWTRWFMLAGCCIYLYACNNGRTQHSNVMSLTSDNDKKMC